MYTIRTWELDMSRTLNKFYATCTGQLSLDKGVLYLLYKSEQPQLLELDHVISAQIESSKSTGACHYVIGIHPNGALTICPSKSFSASEHIIPQPFAESQYYHIPCPGCLQM